MAAPMLVLELVLMGSMYPNKELNGVFVAIGLALALTFWLLIRQQTAISDRQFLESMIPHHAGAILMCEQARLHDPRIQQLCEGLLSSQESEISQMKSLLERHGGRGAERRADE
jgi:uncharacterized protein (DUF305 family)